MVPCVSTNLLNTHKTMEKRYGASGPQNGLEKIGTNRWAVFYGFCKDSDDAETGYNWYQTYNHRPTLDEIKADIVAVIKEESAV